MTKTAAVESYSPAIHFAWSDSHDMASATRTMTDGSEEHRMECKCGTTSHWSELGASLRAAQNRHAAKVAR